MKDGGPAFPELVGGEQWDTRDGDRKMSFESAGGMTLRDYFAAHALASMGGMEFINGADEVAANNGTTRGAVLAQLAYEIADAMLAERDKE